MLATALRRIFDTFLISPSSQYLSYNISPKCSLLMELLQVRERMTYVGSVLEEFVELDEQVVPIKWNQGNISKLTQDKSAKPVSTNQQIHHCHSGWKVQWANISDKYLNQSFKICLSLAVCIPQLDYLSFPILVLWKIFQSFPSEKS